MGVLKNKNSIHEFELDEHKRKVFGDFYNEENSTW